MKRHQSTIRQSVTCEGIGLHSGQPVALTLHPAPIGHGIVFRRTDVDGDGAFVPARYDLVASAAYGTTLRNDAGVEVRTVEHLMAALAASEIDNVLIEISDVEVPILDGSSSQFMDMLDAADSMSQAAPRKVLHILRAVEVRDGDKLVRLEPHEGFQIDCAISFEAAAIARQRLVFNLSRERFLKDISPARTFTQAKDIETLRAHGLAKGGSLDNAVVVDDGQVLNEGGLRFSDECVRHKVLDVLGDLALAGHPIWGRFEGEKMGHTLNNRLLRALFAAPDAYEIVPLGAHRPASGKMAVAAAM